MRRHNRHCNNSAFTLIELMVVISIISVVASLVYASFGTTKAQARDATRAYDSVEMRNALTAYSLDHNGEVPAATTASGCVQSSTNPAVWTCSTANGVSSALAPLISGGYIGTISNDPLNSGAYTYYYSTGPSDGTDPVNHSLLAPSGSFDYVSESQTTNPNSPVVLGINAGNADYITYSGNGYPADPATINGAQSTTTATSTTTAPGQPASLTANYTFNGSQFGMDSSNRVLTAGTGGALPPAQPTSVTVNLSWTNTGGAATQYAVTRNGTKIGVTGGTTYTDYNVALPLSGQAQPAGGPVSLYSYTVTASNSAGTSTPATVNASIPEPWLAVTSHLVDSGTKTGGIENITATLNISSASAPAGTVYNMVYTNKAPFSVQTLLGQATISGGTATYVYNNNSTYNLNTVIPPTYEADLYSEPPTVGN